MSWDRPFDPRKVPAPPGDFKKVLDLMSKAELIDIEIGCGVGTHPISWAQRHPERLVVAMERTTEKFGKFEKSIAQKEAPLENLIPLHTDAVNWISAFVRPEQIDSYFILYPNPYPKERQKNHRFPHMPFSSYLIQTLKPGGKLVMASNIKSYIDETVERFAGHEGMEVLEKKQIEPSEPARTLFEKKYLERREACFNLELKKS